MIAILMLRWFNRLVNRLRHEKPPNAEIRLTDDGFSVAKNQREIISVHWNDIQEIVAFKRDSITTDLVCFSFSTSDGSFEVNEEVPGFSSLQSALEKELPGFDNTWPYKVIKPAFAPNRTVIYRRSENLPER
jgi:hypothetical protein